MHLEGESLGHPDLAAGLAALVRGPNVHVVVEALPNASLPVPALLDAHDVDALASKHYLKDLGLAPQLGARDARTRIGQLGGVKRLDVGRGHSQLAGSSHGRGRPAPAARPQAPAFALPPFRVTFFAIRK